MWYRFRSISAWIERLHARTIISASFYTDRKYQWSDFPPASENLFCVLNAMFQVKVLSSSRTARADDTCSEFSLRSLHFYRPLIALVFTKALSPELFVRRTAWVHRGLRSESGSQDFLLIKHLSPKPNADDASRCCCCRRTGWIDVVVVTDWRLELINEVLRPTTPPQLHHHHAESCAHRGTVPALGLSSCHAHPPTCCLNTCTDACSHQHRPVAVALSVRS